MFTKFQKSAALIITLIIIGSVGTMALVVARSTIMGLRISTNLYAEMVAEEASLAGIELYLRDRNEPALGSYRLCNLELNITNIASNCPSMPMSIPSSGYYVKIEVDGSSIYTTGYYGGKVKKHKFEFDTSTKQVIQDF
jgi:Tfp pilus assembly protein PilX